MISISQEAARLTLFLAEVGPYWQPIVSGLAGLLVISAVLFLLSPEKCPKLFMRPWFFCVLLLLAGVCFRWPLLTAGEQNPDESFLLSAALEFTRSPVGFFSMDLGTHNPLSPFPLALPQLLGIKGDYGLAKLMGLLCMLGSSLLVYASLRIVFSEIIARIGGMLAVFVVSSMFFWDFVAYNGEIPIVLLTMLGLYLVTRIMREPPGWSMMSCFFAGLALGCIPMVKPQGVPGGLLLALVGLYSIIRAGIRHKKAWKGAVLCFISGGLLPVFVFLLFLFSQDLLHDYYVRYFIDLGDYSNASQRSFLQKLTHLSATLPTINRYYTPFFLALTSFTIVASIVLCLLHKRMYKDYSLQRGQVQYAIILLLLFIAEFVSAAYPGNAFEHYYLLLFLPICLLCASFVALAVGELTKRHVCYVYVFVILIVAPAPVLLSDTFLNNRLGDWSNRLKYYGWVPPVALIPKDPVSEAVQRLLPEGATMYVWAWRDSLYVDTGCPPAIRTPFSTISVFVNNKKYYADKIAKELEAAKPTLFVDALAPSSFRFHDREEYGFENFSAVARFVRAHYELAAEVDDVRIYKLRAPAGQP